MGCGCGGEALRGDGGRRSDVELDMDIELEMKISSRLQAAVGVEAKGAGEG